VANGTGGDDLRQLNLNLKPNEASGLLTLENDTLMETHGWELALWAVLDEGRVEDCVALIGHERGAPIGEGWRIERLNARLKSDPGKTEDAESVARHDGRVYVFGSHFGSKDGPLQPKRSFVARFKEDAVEHVTDGPAVEMEVSRKSFEIHRIINDAFKASGPDLVPLGRRSEQAFIGKTIERGEDKGKRWAGLVREGDYPINVEGAAFRADGTLLLGLRFPVSAEGLPIIVGLEGVERLFGPADELPAVTGFWVVLARPADLPRSWKRRAGERGRARVDGHHRGRTGDRGAYLAADLGRDRPGAVPGHLLLPQQDRKVLAPLGDAALA
jgi:hypothetical protein